jgi:AcrR family transcriptional regulator
MDGLAERAGLGKGTVFRRFRFLAGEMNLGATDLDVLATQQTAALEGPLRSQATAKEEGRRRVRGLITQQRTDSALVQT